MISIDTLVYLLGSKAFCFEHRIKTKEFSKEKGFNDLKRLISVCKSLKRSGKWLLVVFKVPTPTAH